MDAMQTTALLSDYGLYAISGLLVACVVYLYKRIGDLEKEMRSFLERHIDSRSKMLAETANALKNSTEALYESNAVLKQTSETLIKLSTATEAFGQITGMMQQMMEKMERKS